MLANEALPLMVMDTLEYAPRAPAGRELKLSAPRAFANAPNVAAFALLL